LTLFFDPIGITEQALVTPIAQTVMLVYGITKGDGSGYNRMGDDQGTKSKAGGAITNGEYRSQETKAST
jgi:hypothetical protein